MAGKKGRSGRKATTDMASVRELFQSVVPDARWRRIFDGLAELALGDGPLAVEAARVLMSYAFGMPVPEVDHAEQVLINQ